jgi:hypothetical protein
MFRETQMNDQKRRAMSDTLSAVGHLCLAVAYFSILACAADFYPKAEGGKIVGAPIGPKDTILFDQEGIQFRLIAKDVVNSVTRHEVKLYFLIVFLGPKPSFMFKSSDFTVSTASEQNHVLPNRVAAFKPTYGILFNPPPEYIAIKDWHSLDSLEYWSYHLEFLLRFPTPTHFVFQVPPMEIDGKEVILPPVTFNHVQ